MQYIIDNTPIVEAEFVMPTQIIIDKGYIYRGITSTEGVVENNIMMINGKAPYGSSEDDAVWTVYKNPIDEFGNVVEEEIEVLENQVWSEIEQMYN